MHPGIFEDWIAVEFTKTIYGLGNNEQILHPGYFRDWNALGIYENCCELKIIKKKLPHDLKKVKYSMDCIYMLISGFKFWGLEDRNKILFITD